RLSLGEHSVQGGAIEIVSVANHSKNLTSIGDIFQGICVEENQVRGFPRFDRATILFAAEELGGAERGSLDGFHRSEAGLPELREFAMQAVAWKNKRVQRIRAHQQGNSSTVQLAGKFPIIDGLAPKPRGVLFHPVVVERAAPLLGKGRRDKIQVRIVQLPRFRMRSNVERSDCWCNPG